MTDFDRITVDTDKMGGVPCVRGLRIPVATVLGLLADGMSTEEVLEQYPDLEIEDIHQVFGYAAYLARQRDIPIPAAS